MIFDWLYRLIYRRQIRDDWCEIAELEAEAGAIMIALSARINGSFSPEQWDEVRDRCERQLTQSVDARPLAATLPDSCPGGGTN